MEQVPPGALNRVPPSLNQLSSVNNLTESNYQIAPV